MLLYRYPPGSAAALLEGTLLLRCCAARFTSKIPSWRLTSEGSVANLVTDGGEEVGIVQVESGGIGVHWVSGPGEGGKGFRLNRKPPAHLAGTGFWGLSIPVTCVEEIACFQLVRGDRCWGEGGALVSKG